jgi:septum formation protein
MHINFINLPTRKTMTHPQPLVSRAQTLILASKSPRRRELLAEAGYQFRVIPPSDDVECGVCSESGPAGLVAELAYRKAAAVATELQRDSALVSSLRPPSSLPIILAADTVAECDGLILGKPRDENDAREMLTRLSNREHRVLTGVCLWPIDLRLGDGGPRRERRPQTCVAVTKLRMDRLTDEQLNEYLSSSKWEGKAGAFGYQDRLDWIHIIDGSPSNVVGLPMELLAEMLIDITQTD